MDFFSDIQLVQTHNSKLVHLVYGAAVFNLWYYPMGIYVPVVLKTESYSSEKELLGIRFRCFCPRLP